VANSVFSSAQKFINIVEKNKSLYESVKYHLLTLKVNEQWTAISGLVRLSFENKKPYIEELFSINNRLLLIHEVEKFDLDKLSDFIDRLRNDTFSLSDKKVFMSERKDPVLKSEEKPLWQIYDLKDSEGWPADILYFSGKDLRDILPDDRDLTDQLRIQQPRGFSSLGELSSQLVGFPISPASATIVYVVAPTYAKLDSILLTSNGILTAAFICHESISTTRLRISVLYYSDSQQVDSFNVSIPFVLTQQRSKFRIYDMNERRDVKDVTFADIFLVEDNKISQRYHVKASSNVIPNLIPTGQPQGSTLSYASILSNVLGRQESNNLEFKSSMLYDKGKNQMNNFLALDLVKAIVSFLNTNGGDVFVGIDPDSKIVGIENDFQYLGKNKNFDGWAQYLSNLISKHLNQITFSSITVGEIQDNSTGKTVVRITMKRHFKPTFMKYVDDQGRQKEEFYIRGLNGKRLLSPEETYQYIFNHWRV
jgi:hypothetical protein